VIPDDRPALDPRRSLILVMALHAVRVREEDEGPAPKPSLVSGPHSAGALLSVRPTPKPPTRPVGSWAQCFGDSPRPGSACQTPALRVSVPLLVVSNMGH
jgi:hypothetical protein